MISAFAASLAPPSDFDATLTCEVCRNGTERPGEAILRIIFCSQIRKGPVDVLFDWITPAQAPRGGHQKIEGHMSSGAGKHDQDHLELLFLYVLQALPSSEVPVVMAHISACAECRHEMETLRPIIGAFVAWPTDVLRPSASLWDRLAQRISVETGQEPLASAPRRSAEPEWEEATPGLSYKLLATDTENDRVSMLVRLAPGAAYPAHRHAGVEELHLLHGELMVDDRTLHAGDYLRADAGSADYRVWSETGCTCVLLTSTRDTIQ